MKIQRYNKIALTAVMKRALMYLLLILFSIIFALPFVWAVSTSLKVPAQVFAFPIRWVPQPIAWSNYAEAFKAIDFMRHLQNTVIITMFAMVGTLLSASLTAYGFARMKFAGKEVLFALMLLTMMVPGQVKQIPVYLLFRNMGWLNTFNPIIVPTFFGGGAFYIFLLRQFFLTIPGELEDAARVDGCTALGIYARIFVPLSKPAMGTAAVFVFREYWDDFMRPLIYLNSKEKYPLTIAMRFFQGEFGTDYHLLMAVSVLAMLPCLILYFSAQGLFVKGVVMSGLKG